MDIELMKMAKKYYDLVFNDMDLLQNKGYVRFSENIKLSNIYKDDFVNFILYVIAADREINIDEVSVYHYLTGYGGDNIDTLKDYIENSDILSYKYQSSVPYSLRHFITAINEIIQQFNDVNLESAVKSYLR